jgi:hypothetical protein
MSLIIRIDVDRPYGRRPFHRHVLSRISSDLYLPTLPFLGYLNELRTILVWLNTCEARACVFFRRCTLPSKQIVELLEAGQHEIGLHLEDSRSFTTFSHELLLLERHTGKKIQVVSKHGSGGGRFGRHHYAPYEPQRYIEWANQAGMRLFLGNLEDPRLAPKHVGGLEVFPSAFWLEPSWRDTEQFPVEWLNDYARHHDVTLLIHPENVLSQANLLADFKKLTLTLQSRIFNDLCACK